MCQLHRKHRTIGYVVQLADCVTRSEGGNYRGYPLNVIPRLGQVACGGGASQHMLAGYEGLDYEDQAEPVRNRRQDFDG